jgi:hypothetical protein
MSLLVNTNELLNLALSVVVQFSQVANVPPAEVPTKTNDLESYVVGSPSSPIDVVLVHRRGARYWFHEGAIQYFWSPSSYHLRTDAGLAADRHIGKAALASNEVAALALNVLQRLIKKEGAVLGGEPIVRVGGPVRGHEVPFYLLSWPRRDAAGSRAEVEIDARNGQLVSLLLEGAAFCDPAMALHISNQVCTIPPGEVSGARPRQGPPRATRDQVEQGIASWLRFCRRLGLDCGSQTNLSDVDWEQSYAGTHASFGTNAPYLQVRLRNGARFECIGAVTVGHFSQDACFVGQWARRNPQQWAAFEGKATFRWEDCVPQVETLLRERLGIPAAQLGLSTYVDLDYSDRNIPRCYVKWCTKRADLDLVPFEDREDALGVELDLRTCTIKSTKFYDSRFFKWLGGPRPGEP